MLNNKQCTELRSIINYRKERRKKKGVIY